MAALLQNRHSEMRVLDSRRASAAIGFFCQSFSPCRSVVMSDTSNAVELRNERTDDHQGHNAQCRAGRD
jgi:hypothetical protein